MELLSRQGLYHLIKSSKGVVIAVAIAVGGYVLLRESIGLETMLSILVFGGCMLMHLFMHGGHGHGHGHGDESKEVTDDHSQREHK